MIGVVRLAAVQSTMCTVQKCTVRAGRMDLKLDFYYSHFRPPNESYCTAPSRVKAISSNFEFQSFADNGGSSRFNGAE